MSNKNNIVTPLDNLPKLNCFKVPQGYFERLHHSIELRVALDVMPFEERLLALKNATAFSLPPNYFDSLANRIAAQTTAAPTLEDLKSTKGFAVPQGYFDTLYMRIANRISSGAITAARPWWQPSPALRPVLAFAGVAVIALAIGLPYFISQNNSNPAGLALVNRTEKLIVPQATADTNTIVAGSITPPQPTVKTNTTKFDAIATTQTNDDADLLGLTGGYGDVMIVSELPTINTTTTAENGLVEILAEEDIDLTELLNSGL